MSTQMMSRYVWGWISIFGAFAITLPIAMVRISQTQKFAGQPFHSQTCENHSPATHQVTVWLTACRQLKGQSLAIQPQPAITQVSKPVSQRSTP